MNRISQDVKPVNTLKECFLDNLWFKVLSFIAVVMIVISLFLPPQGVIDPSVIAAVGEIFAFSALWSVLYALKNGHSAQISHGETTVILKDKQLEDKSLDGADLNEE